MPPVTVGQELIWAGRVRVVTAVTADADCLQIQDCKCLWTQILGRNPRTGGRKIRNRHTSSIARFVYACLLLLGKCNTIRCVQCSPGITAKHDTVVRRWLKSWEDFHVGQVQKTGDKFPEESTNPENLVIGRLMTLLKLCHIKLVQIENFEQTDHIHHKPVVRFTSFSYHYTSTCRTTDTKGQLWGDVLSAKSSSVWCHLAPAQLYYTYHWMTLPSHSVVVFLFYRSSSPFTRVFWLSTFRLTSSRSLQNFGQRTRLQLLEKLSVHNFPSVSSITTFSNCKNQSI